MTYQEQLEVSFLDEMTKIGAGRISSLVGHKLLGSTLGTWGKRALVGAVPGAVAGAVTAEPGRGFSGAIKGGLVGGTAGVVGGGLLQRKALNAIPGFKDVGYGGLTDSAKMRALFKDRAARKAYSDATRSTFPGLV